MSEPRHRSPNPVVTLLTTALIIGLADGLAGFFASNLQYGPIPPTKVAMGLGIALAGGLGLGAGVAAIAGLIVLGARGLTKRLISRLFPSQIARPATGQFIVAAPLVAYSVGALLVGAPDQAHWIILGALVGLALLEFLAPVLEGTFTRPIFGAAMGILLTYSLWMACCNRWDSKFDDEAVLRSWWSAGPPVILALMTLCLNPGALKRGALGATILLTGGWLFLVTPRITVDVDNGRPSVLMIVVDTLRTDRAWGDTSVMPAVASLAKRGVYFENAYTAIPKTHQSMASMMSGRYPWTSGVRNFQALIPENLDNLAQRFSRAGYATGAFVHNPWIGYSMGHERGFGQFYDYYRLASVWPDNANLFIVGLVDDLIGRSGAASKNTVNVDGAQLTQAAISWLKTNGDHPYFLWVHYFDPHWPYTPPPGAPGRSDGDIRAAEGINGGLNRETLMKMRFAIKETGISDEAIAAAIRLYSAESAYTDGQIASLLKAIEGPNQPLIVLVADHGESLGEHDYHFFHGNYTYNVSLRIPMLLSWPGHLPQNRIVTDKVQAVDLLPTLTHLAGLETGKTDGLPMPGLGIETRGGDPLRIVPFEGDSRGRTSLGRVPLAGSRGRWRGVIMDHTKMIAIPGEQGFEYEIYDLDEDPYETNNLYRGDPAQARPFVDAMISAGLSDWQAAEEHGRRRFFGEESDGSLSPEEQQRLEALGYMQ